MEEEEDQEVKKRKHKLFVKFRDLLLYGFLPVCMVVSIVLLLVHSEGTCRGSKVIT